MKVRYKKNRDDVFGCSRLNTSALAEVLTGDDSAYFSDLEVYVEKLGQWKCLREAFRDKDVITDNYNTEFREPKNDEERKRGWY